MGICVLLCCFRSQNGAFSLAASVWYRDTERLLGIAWVSYTYSSMQIVFTTVSRFKDSERWCHEIWSCVFGIYGYFTKSKTWACFVVSQRELEKKMDRDNLWSSEHMQVLLFGAFHLFLSNFFIKWWVHSRDKVCQNQVLWEYGLLPCKFQSQFCQTCKWFHSEDFSVTNSANQLKMKGIGVKETQLTGIILNFHSKYCRSLEWFLAWTSALFSQ